MTQSVETTSELSLPSPKERRRLRESADLTHEDVAAAVGVTPNTVRSWETGRTEPRGRKREAYARLLARIAAPVQDPPCPDPAPDPDPDADPDADREIALAEGGAADTPATGPGPVSAPHTGGSPKLSGGGQERPGGAGTRPKSAAPNSAAPQAAKPPAPLPGHEALPPVRITGSPAPDTPAHGSADGGEDGEPHGPGGRPVGAAHIKAALPEHGPHPASAAPAASPEAGAAPQPAPAPCGGAAAPEAPAACPPAPGTPPSPETALAPVPTPEPGTAAATASAETGAPTQTADAAEIAEIAGTAGAGATTAPTTPDGSAPSDVSAEGAESAASADADPAGPAEAADPAEEPTGSAESAASDDTPAPPPGPARDFDALYAHAAATLTRQAYLLTGRRALAHEAVERAFQRAWANWPEVAADPDPVGWVRAAAYECALSPWHLLRRAHRHPDKPPVEPADRILLDAMLALPVAHRRTVLLYDGVGLDLPDTAAETEASTPTAGGRLIHAHAHLADRIPELAGVPPEKQSAVLRERLTALAPAVRIEPRPAAVVRTCGERRTRRWTRAALGLTAVIAAATAYTATTAPTRYEPPNAPGANVSGVPPLSGPQQLTEESRQLHDKLRADPAAGPARVAPRID
ncbi:helix-turn-helix domain-containing protein [Streptomyces sp. CB00455]|uniref:helix-turn-helix domain-containing protein n=1 Tax=Streptomyces sp. CB00455 TaxID=1703927 RepID=UPI000939F52F